MEEVLVMEEEAMEEDILLKFAVIMEGQDIPLIHAIENIPLHFKFKNQNHDQSHTNAVFHNTNFNNDELNHEVSK